MAGRFQAYARIYTRVAPPMPTEKVRTPQGGFALMTTPGRPEDARLGLCWFLKVCLDDDLIVGPPALQNGPNAGSELFRLTYHETGVRNLHSGKESDDYVRLTPTRPLHELKGIHPVGAWVTPGVVDSSDTPRKDTATRRAVVSDFPVSSVVLWLVEAQRQDLLEMFQGENRTRLELVPIVWTVPHYVVEVFTDIPVERGRRYAGGEYLVPTVHADGSVSLETFDENDPRAPGAGLSSFGPSD